MFVCPFCNEEANAIRYKEEVEVFIDDDGGVDLSDASETEPISAMYFCPLCNTTLKPGEDIEIL